MSIPSSTIANSLASSTGLNSGLDIDGIITKLMAIESQPITTMQDRQKTIKQKMSAYSTIQGKANDVLVAVKKMTSRNFDGTNLFDNMTAASSTASIATATVAAGAASQNLTLEVKSLPTQTKAASTSQVGKFDNATVLGDLGITDGTFTMYVNGATHTYTVASTQTMGDLFNAINADFPGPGSPTVPQITASIAGGKVSMAYTGGAATDIRFGSGSDTSNALAKLQLNTAVDNDTDTITGSRVVTAFSTSMTLSGASAYLNTPITDGTFSINGVSFDTTGKSLSTLMTEINGSASAKVTATFNTASNRFELVSKDSGSALISLSDGTGNFLTSMGLVNGADTTTSQTSGKNAEFVLNGVTLYSTSATVDESVTGLSGITLNLKQASPGNTTQITIQKDTAGIVAAVKDVITKYNAAMTAIDQQTDAKNGGLLANESRIKTLRNSLRNLFTSQVAGITGAYDSLQQVGITTGAVGTGLATNGSPQLQLDESKLTSALVADPTTVRKLFVGQDLTNALDGSSGDDNMEGALTRVSHLLSDQIYTDGTGGYGALYTGTTDSDKGLFASYQASQQKLIDSLNESIQRTQDRLSLKEDRLRKQYTAMDQLVGQYQQQGNALAGLINSLKNS